MNNKHHPLNLVMVVMEVNPRGGAGAGQGLLGEYGINITEAARQGDIDPVVGRDQEIKRVIEILNRRTKQPVLIGEPGVGKQPLLKV